MTQPTITIRWQKAYRRLCTVLPDIAANLPQRDLVGEMTVQPTGSARRVPAGLVALALDGFRIGLTEFVIGGLLPQVSRSLGVSVPASRYSSGWSRCSTWATRCPLSPLVTR